MADRYRAHIIETHEDWMRRTVRVLIQGDRLDGQADLLMGDGTWQTIEQGTVTNDPPGIVVPVEAVEASARCDRGVAGTPEPRRYRSGGAPRVVGCRAPSCR